MKDTGGKGKNGGGKVRQIEPRYSSDFLDRLDERYGSTWALRGYFQGLTNSLGGASDLSYQELSLCMRLIHLEELIRQKEQKLASGQAIDESIYCACVNTFSGLINKLGLKRRPKPTQTLAAILAEAGSRDDLDETEDRTDHS